MPHCAAPILTRRRREAGNNTRSLNRANNGGYLKPFSFDRVAGKKENCGFGYSNCSVCTVFVHKTDYSSLDCV